MKRPDSDGDQEAADGKGPDAAADEEAADLSRSLTLIDRDGSLGAPALAAHYLLSAPDVWLRRGAAIGAFLCLPWVGAALRGALVAPPDPHGASTFLGTLVALTLGLAGLVPVAGAAAFRAFADGRRPEWRDWEPVVDALPAYALHLAGAWTLAELLLAREGLGAILGAPLGLLLAFSWLVTAGELGAMRRGQHAMVRGPARAVGYLLRLPGRVTDPDAPRPRLGTTMFLWAGTTLGAAMLGAVLANGVLWVQGMAPLALGPVFELLAAWAYATCIALALDAGAGLWTYRYLAHQVSVGALEAEPQPLRAMARAIPASPRSSSSAEGPKEKRT